MRCASTSEAAFVEEGPGGNSDDKHGGGSSGISGLVLASGGVSKVYPSVNPRHQAIRS
jgi:hypothetical protein